MTHWLFGMMGLNVASCSLDHIRRVIHNLRLVRWLRMFMRPVGCCKAAADCDATERNRSQARAVASCHDCKFMPQTQVWASRHFSKGLSRAAVRLGWPQKEL